MWIKISPQLCMVSFPHLPHFHQSKEVYFELQEQLVVAQLVERSLPIPEARGLNPVIGKKLYWTFTVNCIEKTKIKKKRPGMAHFRRTDRRRIECRNVWNCFDNRTHSDALWRRRQRQPETRLRPSSAGQLKHQRHWQQCDQIGRFLKSLGDDFSLKSSQKLWWFGLKWKVSFFSKSYCVPFLGKFFKMGYFLIHI